MKEAHERVKAVMNHYGLNKNSFSKEVGFSQSSTIGRIINEGRKPSVGTLKKIVARFPEISYDWLLMGKGDMLIEPTLSQQERIEKLCDYAGMSEVELAANIGVHSSFVKDLKRDNEEITPGIANDVIKAFPGVNYEWILNGKGEMLNQKNEAQLIPQNYMKVPKIPIYAQAGFLVGYGDPEYMDELPEEVWEAEQEYKGQYLSFEVKGDSMDDGSRNAIVEGDRLLCREIQRHHWENRLHLKKWYFVIAHKTEGVIVKQIKEHDPKSGVILCHSLNEFYDDFEINLKDVVALFNVVDMKRSLKM